MNEQPSLFGAATEDSRPFRVSELVERLRSSLERGFSDVWVEGEVSNLRIPRSGHAYFTLKDDQAQLRAVLWRSRRETLGFELEEGLAVLLRGDVSVYADRGDLQLLVRWAEPRGLGALTLAFEKLKQRLDAEGLFAAERKRALPVLPRRIGVVTSPTGAALRDILQVIGRRYANVRILIAPTRVQGEGAAEEIREALGAITRVEDVDVVILARGGGSIEDLWAFNDESLARAVAACPVPVVSAVGHETDFTIADFVADQRAPTPSAAAEQVLQRKDELAAKLETLERRAEAATRARIESLRLRLARLAGTPSFTAVSSLPERTAQRLDELAARLEAGSRLSLTRARHRLDALARTLTALDVRSRLVRWGDRRRGAAALLGRAAAEQISTHRARLARLEAALGALSPYAVLERGYSIASDGAGHVLTKAEQVAPGETVNLRLREGSLVLSVIARKE
jgi:exodeoxyribonuclease VII large subunit